MKKLQKFQHQNYHTTDRNYNSKQFTEQCKIELFKAHETKFYSLIQLHQHHSLFRCRLLRLPLFLIFLFCFFLFCTVFFLNSFAFKSKEQTKSFYCYFCPVFLPMLQINCSFEFVRCILFAHSLHACLPDCLNACFFNFPLRSLLFYLIVNILFQS